MKQKASFVNFSIGNACNLRCKFCYNDTRRDKKQYFEDIEVLKERLLKYDFIGKKSINLIGGEPLMYPKIFELLDFLNKHNFTLRITTNGIKLADKSFVESFLKYKSIINSITISVHSHKGLIEDKITGRKSGFIKKIGTIETLKKYNVPFSLTTTLCNDNIDFLEEIIDFFAKKYNKRLSFQGMMTTHNSSLKNTESLPKYSKIIEVFNNFKSNNQVKYIHWIPLCIHFKIKNKNYIIRELNRYYLYASNGNGKNLYSSQIDNNYVGDKCRKCFAFSRFCFGPGKKYVDKYGYDEFTSLKKEEVISLIKQSIKNKLSK